MCDEKHNVVGIKPIEPIFTKLKGVDLNPRNVKGLRINCFKKEHLPNDSNYQPVNLFLQLTKTSD